VSLQDPRYLTVAEVARLLRLSKMTIYRMIEAEDIEAVRVGGRVYRIPEAAVRPFLPAPCEERTR